MVRSMCMSAVFLIASTVVQADQCSSGGECKSSNEPQRVVSLLQMELQMNVLEESVEDAKGGKKDVAPKAKAAAKKEGSPKAKPKAEPKKEEANGKAKTKAKKNKQVELAGGLVLDGVLDGTSQWISCTFDWNTLSHAHLASKQWGFIMHNLNSKLKERRESLKMTFTPISSTAQSNVPERLEPLLQVAASTLDNITVPVNWYLAFGSEIGRLRSEAFIPWDEDVDVVVKMSDRVRVCDYIREGDSEAQGDVTYPLSVYRSIPDHPELLMAGHYTSEHTCHKVIWVDVETEVAIDMCIDCGDKVSASNVFVNTTRALFGNVNVSVPEHPFDASIQNEHGVDKAQEQISMKTSGGGWKCTRHQCTEEPPTGTSAASLEDVYSTNPSAMRGPFDFHMDLSDSLRTTAQCSLPRNFESCLTKTVDVEEVWVQPCQSSPWAASVSTQVTLVDSALNETKQVMEYQMGPWMVVQLLTK